MFIVFEGIDGSGTTTQAKLLAENLAKNSVPVCLTAEPTNGEIGKFIRAALCGKKVISPRTLQLLFFADREEHLQIAILPALKESKTVISDRYCLSTIAYAAFSGDEKLFVEIAKHFPTPDLTIFLDLPVEIALQRIEQRNGKHEIFEKKELLETIGQAYRHEMEKIADEKKLLLDGALPKATLSAMIWERVKRP